MRRGDAGFSLVEIMIASAIMAIFVVAVYLLLESSSTSYTNVDRLGTLQDTGRVTLDNMAKELRAASLATVVITTVAGSSQVSFKYATNYSGGAVVLSPTTTYQVGTAGGRPGQTLSRTQGASTRHVCDYVQAGGFVATQSGNNLNLALTLVTTDNSGKNLRATVQTSVTIRDP